MNAQSTPVKDKRKLNVTNAFNELTPITESNFLEEKRYFGKRVKRENIKRDGTETESDEEPPIKSQVHKYEKKRKSEGNENKSEKTFFTQNEDVNSSDDLIGDEIGDERNLYIDSKSQYHSNKTQFLDSGIDKLLLNVPYDLEKNEVQAVNNYSSKEFDIKLFKNELSNESLSVSDVMKWSDNSLVPQENESHFSSLIKRKLLENANNKDIIKSQTSGWTQYEFSKILNSHSCDIGPFHGLPSRVQELYKEHKGINELFSWQEDCLNLDAIKQRKNLVYSLPTSGGKSLVAEILILKEILINHKNVLFVLPFVSIVQEKIRDFSHFALEFNFALEEYAAGKGRIPPRKHRKKNSLMIATIEKGLIVINSLIEANRLAELGLVVVDELHLLLEEGRGPILETLLIQILHCKEKIQIIGMTATIGNLEEVAMFLKAESYAGNFRPLRLLEYIKCGTKIYSVDLSDHELTKEIRVLDSQDGDTDGIAQLVQEVMPEHSVLVFCPTKKNCENIAALLCKVLPRNLKKWKEAEKTSLLRALMTETNDKVCPILWQTLPFGVAYHHSGLTVGERKLLEEGFRQGTVSVICCTSTLAVGVNLPARRVILRSPYVGRDFISLSKYKQMVGRAGRTGFGNEGESFLICQPADLQKVENLFRSRMDEVTSKMDLESCQNLILSSIGLGTATTRETLKELMTCSLLHNQVLSVWPFPLMILLYEMRIMFRNFKILKAKHSKLNIDTDNMVDECLDSLRKQGALVLKTKEVKISEEVVSNKSESDSLQREKGLKMNNCQLIVSRLGRAAVKSGLNLEAAHELYGELLRAQESLVLLTNLHLLYLVTPCDFLGQIKPNYSIFFNVYMKLDAKDIQAARAIGITECVVSKLAVGCKPKKTKDAVLSRFYVSLILYELWNQKTVWDVSQLFQVPRGLVQTLMTSAATFVNNVLRFCEEFEEFWSFKSLLSDFAPRLAHCCAPELLPLMDLPAVKRGRAKQLYDAGFKTIHKIALAEPAELVRSLDHMPYSAASQIVAAAKLLLMEKAESLREEAELVLEGLSEKAL